jgi:hypothetical protein
MPIFGPARAPRGAGGADGPYARGEDGAGQRGDGGDGAADDDDKAAEEEERREQVRRQVSQDAELARKVEAEDAQAQAWKTESRADQEERFRRQEAENAEGMLWRTKTRKGSVLEVPGAGAGVSPHGAVDPSAALLSQSTGLHQEQQSAAAASSSQQPREPQTAGAAAAVAEGAGNKVEQAGGSQEVAVAGQVSAEVAGALSAGAASGALSTGTQEAVRRIVGGGVSGDEVEKAAAAEEESEEESEKAADVEVEAGTRTPPAAIREVPASHQVHSPQRQALRGQGTSQVAGHAPHLANSPVARGPAAAAQMQPTVLGSGAGGAEAEAADVDFMENDLAGQKIFGEDARALDGQRRTEGEVKRGPEVAAEEATRQQEAAGG